MSNHDSATQRDEIDPVFKEIMTFNFGQLAVPVETQVEVSRLPRTMDALVVLQQAEDRERVRVLTAFDYFQTHNQLEYKGKADRLNRQGYHRIRGRSHLYLAQKNITSSEMTVTIISARKPVQVLNHSRADVRWENQGGGRYRSTDLLPVHLFVCNELVITPKNYPLLLFATSRAKFRQFVEQIVSEENTVYIYYASRVEPEMTKEVLKMAGKQSVYEEQLQRIAQSMGEDLIPFLKDEKTLKQIAQSMGEDLIPFLSDEKILKQIAQIMGEDLIPFLSDEKTLKQIAQSMGEDVLKYMTPENRVHGLTLNERLDGLAPKDLATLSPETKEKLLQLLLTPDRKPDQTEDV